MAEEEGFEPPIPFQVRQFSRLEPSTTRPLFRTLMINQTPGPPRTPNHDSRHTHPPIIVSLTEGSFDGHKHKPEEDRHHHPRLCLSCAPLRLHGDECLQ